MAKYKAVRTKAELHHRIKVQAAIAEIEMGELLEVMLGLYLSPEKKAIVQAMRTLVKETKIVQPSLTTSTLRDPMVLAVLKYLKKVDAIAYDDLLKDLPEQYHGCYGHK